MHMPLNTEQSKSVLSNARGLVGTPYSQLDCSHFVYKAYTDAGMIFPYRNTAEFDKLVKEGYFDKLTPKGGGAYDLLAGDLIMFDGHIGIWDPEGCSVVSGSNKPNANCTKFNNNAPLLSSLGGRGSRDPDHGPDFLPVGAFKKAIKAVYRWKQAPPAGSAR